MFVARFRVFVACQADCSQCSTAGAGKCDDAKYCDSTVYPDADIVGGLCICKLQ